ncbi:MAG: hypothetical protein WCT77_00155, partial [Bacteroidota bacterium]
GLLNHLLAHNYLCVAIYIEADSLNQLLKPFSYVFYIDTNGNSETTQIVPRVKPSQQFRGNVLTVENIDMWIGKQTELILSSLAANETIRVRFILDDEMNDFLFEKQLIDKGGVFCQ